MTGSRTKSRRINNDRQEDKEQKDQQWQAVTKRRRINNDRDKDQKYQQ